MPRLRSALVLAAGLVLLVSSALPSRVLAETAPPASREQIKLSFAPVVRQATPAVVNIYTRRVIHAAASPLFADPFFRHFFGDALPPGMTRDRVQNSLGSGVIVGADGVVVTNHHVIADADQVTVVLSDRREFEAKVVGSDDRSDLAVLKIDTKGEKLPTLPFGDSDALEVGDLVLAIGDPFGVGQTVTSGIVSALARTNVGVSDYRSFIQTDAAINPGNSGGALVDMDGRLVGINAAIYSQQGGGSIGIGFAIPSTLVKVVLTDILKGGKVVHPYMGASGQAVTAELAKSLGLARPAGVLINAVAKDGPAARAGLKPGDVVTAVAGHPVDDPEAMRFRLATLPPDGEAPVAVLRDGAPLALSVHLEAPPEIPPRDSTAIDGNNPLAGATLANLNPALAEELSMTDSASGVVVTAVAAGSIADRLQWQKGDILLKINNRPVPSVAEAKSLLAAGVRTWRISLNRGGETLNLTIGG